MYTHVTYACVCVCVRVCVCACIYIWKDLCVEIILHMLVRTLWGFMKSLLAPLDSLGTVIRS